MSKTFHTNTKVKWDWGNSTAIGYIREIYRETVTKTLKGSEVTRHGSEDNPAYVVEQQDGDEVLKLQSELRKSS